MAGICGRTSADRERTGERPEPASCSGDRCLHNTDGKIPSSLLQATVLHESIHNLTGLYDDSVYGYLRGGLFSSGCCCPMPTRFTPSELWPSGSHATKGENGDDRSFVHPQTLAAAVLLIATTSSLFPQSTTPRDSSLLQSGCARVNNYILTAR